MRHVNPDFNIIGTGMFGVNPYITVQGQAGRTIPHAHEDGNRPHVHHGMNLPHVHRDFEIFYAYVAYTDSGVWAANAHDFAHGGSSGADRWHCERLVFEDMGVPDRVVALENVGRESMNGHDILFYGTGARQIFRAMTMSFQYIGLPGMAARVMEIFDVKYP